MTIETVLKKYWGYDSFKSFQKEIITDILANKDIIALLPTGGGKSLCYQIPALIKKGICVVVSPLVSLIENQVNRLNNQGVKALGLTGNYVPNELLRILDNCQYGGIKLLYISPERLKSKLFMERIGNMPVSLIAIDEAHCISQWGHDFRPFYRLCGNLKKLFPKAPLLALTGSATNEVIEDIANNLEIPKTNIYSHSFERSNIAYKIFKTNNTLFELRKLLSKNNSIAIVYASSRNQTETISNYLNSTGLKANFYHSKVTKIEKSSRLKAWLTEEIQIMVATSAFGMGIDKSNVRIVIHVNIPDSVESYYQETGRIGRDNKPSDAYLFLNQDILNQTKSQFKDNLIGVSYLKEVYRRLNICLKIPYGGGVDESYDLNLLKFCKKYTFESRHILKAFSILDLYGVLQFTKDFVPKTKVQFIVSSDQLFEYYKRRLQYKIFILALLRTYPGIFSFSQNIDVNTLCGKLKITKKVFESTLEVLSNEKIIIYIKPIHNLKITFLVPREDDKTVNLIAKNVSMINKNRIKKLQSIMNFLLDENDCKNTLLLNYFNEKKETVCGKCSTCLAKSETKITNQSFQNLSKSLLDKLKNKPTELKHILTWRMATEKEMTETLDILLDIEKLGINSTNKFYIKGE